MVNLLSVKEAANLLGVSPYTLQTWKTQGYIPFVRLGRRTLFDPDDLRTWIEKQKIPVEGTGGA